MTHTTAPGSGRGKAYKDHRKRVKLEWRHQGHKLFVFRLDDLLPNHVDGRGLAAPASKLCMSRLLPVDMCFSSQPTTTVLIGDPNSRPPNRTIFYLTTERVIATCRLLILVQNGGTKPSRALRYVFVFAVYNWRLGQSSSGHQFFVPERPGKSKNPAKAGFFAGFGRLHILHRPSVCDGIQRI